MILSSNQPLDTGPILTAVLVIALAVLGLIIFTAHASHSHSNGLPRSSIVRSATDESDNSSSLKDHQDNQNSDNYDQSPRR